MAPWKTIFLQNQGVCHFHVRESECIVLVQTLNQQHITGQRHLERIRFSRSFPCKWSSMLTGPKEKQCQNTNIYRPYRAPGRHPQKLVLQTLPQIPPQPPSRSTEAMRCPFEREAGLLFDGAPGRDRCSASPAEADHQLDEDLHGFGRRFGHQWTCIPGSSKWPFKITWFEVT